MILVSEPEARLFVSSTEVDNRETTVVLPELSRAKVEYFKCLVDAGNAFREHAVVMWEGDFVPDDDDVLLLSRALIAARPTEISFLTERGPMDARGQQADVTRTAACAVVMNRGDLGPGGTSAQGLRITKAGRFYTCVAL